MPKQHSQRSLSSQNTRENEETGLVERKLSNLSHKDDPIQVIMAAEEILTSSNDNEFSSSFDNVLFKAMTLNEFTNGALLSMAVEGHCKTFAIDLMRKFQVEYGCSSPSEKATAELAAVSFVRTLDVQTRITKYLDIGTFTDIGVGYLAFLSKELDRANRHYLTAIQTLRMLRQPPMKLNIKANTAVVGQNQIIQANANNGPK